jgi:Tol biopolymer transport system component
VKWLVWEVSLFANPQSCGPPPSISELPRWSPDDKKAKPVIVDRLQFKRDTVGYIDRHRMHLYVLAVGDERAEPVQITSSDFDDADPAWSPDGKSVTFVSNRTDNPDGNPNTDIWIVSPDNTDKGKTLLQVTTNPREDSSPAWSRDGQTITYVTVTAPLKVMWYATNHLATVSARGGTPTVWTTTLDRNVMKPTFAPDGKSIRFILKDGGEQNLASLDLSTKAISRAITGESTVLDYDSAGGTVASFIPASRTDSSVRASSRTVSSDFSDGLGNI